MRSQWARLEVLLDDGLFGPSADTDAVPVVHVSRLVGFKPVDDAVELVTAAVARATPILVEALLEGDRIDKLVVADASTSVAATVDGATPAGDAVLRALAAACVTGHDVKALWRAALHRGIDLGVPGEDTAIAANLLDSSSGRYRLEEVFTDATGDVAPWIATAGPATLMDDPDVADEELRERAAAIAAISETFAPRLGEPVQQALLGGMELPLLRVLARMEDRGIRVDAAVLRGIAEELRAEAASLEVAIHAAVGHDFQINSTKQLQVVLYDELGLTKGRKTKTGYSTDAATLEALRGEHDVVDMLLRFREVDKLRSTYGESLAAEVREDGRIHATFRQTVARTGRLSSEQPNLHNIPTRTEDGRRI